MAIPITSTIKRTTRLTPEEWEQISPEAWAHAGEVHHRELMARHFTEEGAREYGYRQRDADYTRRKRAWAGHTDPLVLTGRLRDEVLRSRSVRPYSSRGGRQAGVTITVSGAYTRDIERELRVVSAADGRLLADRMAKFITVELAREGKAKEMRQ